MWRRWNRRVIGDAVIIYAPNFQKKKQKSIWILNFKLKILSIDWFFFAKATIFFSPNVRIEKCSLWIVSVDNTVSMRSIHTRAILQQFQYTYVTESMFFSLFSSFAHFSLVAHCQSIRLRQATQPNAIHKMQRTATCHDINWIHELFICDSNVKTCFHFNVSAAEFLCGAGALGIIKCTLTNLITANCTPKWHVHCSAWFVVAFDMANISIYCKACMQDKDTYEQKKQKSIKQIANWLFFAQKKHNKKIVQACSVCKYMLRNRFASSSQYVCDNTEIEYFIDCDETGLLHERLMANWIIQSTFNFSFLSLVPSFQIAEFIFEIYMRCAKMCHFSYC